MPSDVFTPGGTKEAFHLVCQALETLADPEARKRYDRSMTSKAMCETRKRRTRGPSPAQKKGPTPPTANCSKKPRRVPSTEPAASDIPQSKGTKVLMKTRDLLKQLPRGVRNDVITNQFSQKQRLILGEMDGITAPRRARHPRSTSSDSLKCTGDGAKGWGTRWAAQT